MAKWEFTGCKIPPEEYAAFQKKAGDGQVSLVLRELIKLFNAGKIVIKIEKTIGG